MSKISLHSRPVCLQQLVVRHDLYKTANGTKPLRMVRGMLLSGKIERNDARKSSFHVANKSVLPLHFFVASLTSSGYLINLMYSRQYATTDNLEQNIIYINNNNDYGKTFMAGR